MACVSFLAKICWFGVLENVARYVGEAEYRAVAQEVTEIMWLKSLFSELGYPLAHVPILWCDNLAAKNIAENLVFHSRTMHIEIDVHFI